MAHNIKLQLKTNLTVSSIKPSLPSNMGSFTLKEAAFLTHVSRFTLRHECIIGKIQGYRSSNCGYWRIGRASLINFMEQVGIPLDLALQGTCPHPDAYSPKDFHEYNKRE